MIHVWGVETKRKKERSIKETQKERGRQEEKWQGKHYKSLVSWKVT